MTPAAPATSREKSIATGELIFAASIWGFGFIATIWALTGMGPVWLSSLRFLGATVPVLPILYLMRSTRAQMTRASLWAAFFPGLFLTLTLVLQTWGLRFTTATKSSFITTLYVVFVPVVERFVFGRSMTAIQVGSVVVALAGTAMIAQLHGFADLNLGDLLTFLCAIAATFHILAVGHYGRKVRSSIVFNTYQSLWAGLLPLGLAIAIEPLPHDFFGTKPFAGFLILAIGSTFLAFLLQIRAQKLLSPSVASMLFLLESPFAACFAYFLLGERLNASQWLGAALIVAAVVASSLEEARKPAPAIAPAHAPV